MTWPIQSKELALKPFQRTLQFCRQSWGRGEFPDSQRQSHTRLSRSRTFLRGLNRRRSVDLNYSDDSAETRELLALVAAGNAPALDKLLSLHRPYLERVISMRIEPELRSRVERL